MRLYLADKSAGKDITNISNAPHEKEVLFMRNSKYKILDVKKEEGKKLVFLQELSGEKDVSYDLVGLYYKNDK